MTAVYKVHVRRGNEKGEVTIQASDVATAQQFILDNNPGIVITGVEQIAAVPTPPTAETSNVESDEDDEDDGEG